MADSTVKCTHFLWWFLFSHLNSFSRKLLFAFLLTRNWYFFLHCSDCCYIILFVYEYSVSILVIIATCALAQNYPYNVFSGCDYYENIELNRVYDVFSPFYPGKYPPGTNCRWSGCAPYGTNIVIKCSDMAIPTVINDSECIENSIFKFK